MKVALAEQLVIVGMSANPEPNQLGHRLLGSSPSRLRPGPRITSGMEDCEHHDAPGFDTVEHGIREARNECAAYFTMYAREHLRIALDCVKGGIDCGKELLTKPWALPFVVPESCGQVPPNLRTVNDRKSH